MNNKIYFNKSVYIIFIFFIFILTSVSVFSYEQEIKIGILANNGKDKCIEDWNYLSDYLTDNNERWFFSIVPLDFNEIQGSVEDGSIDFLLCNPLVYVELEINNNVKLLLTLKRHYDFGDFAFFSSLIFTSSENSRIQNFVDLENSRVAAVEVNSLGGYLMGARELQKAGLKIPDSFKSLQFLGSHYAVVKSVLDGESDAGIIRSGTIENLISDGVISRNQIRNIGNLDHNNDNLPFMHSTDHYPEWPMLQMEHSSELSAKYIVQKLLSLEDSNNTSWSIASNYEIVREDMKALKYGPYKDYGKISFLDSVLQHLWYHLVLFSVMLILSILSLIIYNVKKDLNSALEEKKILLEKSDIVILKVLLNGKIVEANLTASIRFDKSVSELEKSYLSDLISPDQLKLRNEGMKQALETGEKVIIQSECYKGWSEIEIQPVFNKQKGELEYFNFLITDITKWVEIDLELKKMNTMLGLLKEMIVITDKKGDIVDFNKSFAYFNGYKKEDLINKNINITLTDDSEENIGLRITNNQISSDGFDKDLLIKKQNGIFYTAHIRIIPLKDNNNKIINYICVIRDRSDEIAASKAEREHTKVQAIDNIVSGAAHDFNNYLMKIMGLAEIISIKGREISDVLLLSSKLVGEAKKASNVIDKLLNIIHTGSENITEPVCLNELIISALNDYQKSHLLDRNIEKNLSEDLWPVLGVKGFFSDSMIEVVKNSIEATESGDTITIKSRNLPDKSKMHFNAKYWLEEKDYVLIEVSDSGTGIASEIMERVFDPYFSTKGLGKGFGLYLVSNYVQSLYGIKYIESKKDTYTTVSLFFPRYVEKKES